MSGGYAGDSQVPEAPAAATAVASKKHVTVTNKTSSADGAALSTLEFDVEPGTSGEDFLKLLRAAFALDPDASVELKDNDQVGLAPDYANLEVGAKYFLADAAPGTEDQKPQHIVDGVAQGLSKGVSSTWGGITSLVSKTTEGAKTGGVGGFLSGLGQGTLDLGKGVVGGTCDVVQCTLEGARNTPDAIAEVVDKQNGVERAEGEKPRILESSLKEDEKAPAHVGEGLVTGVSSLGKGVIGGLTDLATKPVEGAQQEGALGFFKGLGHGIAGATKKTVAGTLDAASAVTTGVKNTGDYVSEGVTAHGGGIEGAAGATQSAVAGAAENAGKAAGDAKEATVKFWHNSTATLSGWFSKMNDDSGSQAAEGLPSQYKTADEQEEDMQKRSEGSARPMV